MKSRRPTILKARALRQEMSLPEVLLWQVLRGGKIHGLRFRRQQPMGPYIADFFCPALRLVVEVDGASHHTDERPEDDRRRDAWMQAQGMAVLRLPAGLVLSDMDAAVRMIMATAGAAPSTASRSPSPTLRVEEDFRR